MAKAVQCAAIEEAEGEPDFLALEMQALTSLTIDLVTAVAALAPGALDRTLQVARVRLQLLETGRKTEAVDDEPTILRLKISLLERALGRKQTQT